MKKVSVLFFVILSSTLAFGQSIDDLSDVANARLKLSGQRIEVRPPREWNDWDPGRQMRIRKTLEGAFSAIGALPTWSTDEILREADDLDTLNGRQWVDQTSLPKTGMAVGRYIAEFVYKIVSKRSEFEAWMGRWGSGSDIAFDTRSSRFALQLIIRDREKGSTAVGYEEVLGLARDVDNGLVAVSKLFGNQLGIRVSEEGDEERDERAQEKAAKKMVDRIKKQYG